MLPPLPGIGGVPAPRHRPPCPLRRAYLVPSFSFGENDLFRQVVFEEGSWMRSIQKRFQKMMGFAPCVFYGRGLTSVRSRGFLPYARPITTVGEHCPPGRRGPREAEGTPGGGGDPGRWTGPQELEGTPGGGGDPRR